MNYSSISIEELEALVRDPNNADALCEMATRCLHGTGGQSQNYQNAYKYFHKAEALGDARAYQGLGDMYKQGFYLAQSDEKANEYYQKAGYIPPSYEPTPTPVHTPSQPTHNTPQTVDLYQLQSQIDQGQMLREKGRYSEAKQAGQSVIQQIQQIRSGSIASTGNEDIDILQIDAYWLLAFTAFNESDYKQMEHYISQPGVDALHPWSIHLLAMIHKVNGESYMTLENDMQHLIDVSQNQNLTPDQRGDVLSDIGEFYLAGLHSQDGDAITLAYQYFQEAASCGNLYAQEQVNMINQGAY